MYVLFYICHAGGLTGVQRETKHILESHTLGVSPDGDVNIECHLK